MKFIPKCDAVIAKLYEWNLDDNMRHSMGGAIVPSTYAQLSASYNQKYDGVANILIGVANDSNEVVGCYMIERDLLNDRGNMHFVFQPTGRNGILKQSATEIIDHCFFELGLHSVYGYINSENKPACGFVEKMGWECITTIKNYYTSRNGRQDCNLYMLTQKTRRF